MIQKSVVTDDPEASHSGLRTGVSTIRKAFVKAFFLGLAAGSFIFLLDMSRECSKEATFARIQIDMPATDAISILGAAEISCGLTLKTKSAECTFSDYWRNYLIAIDPAMNVVVRKTFEFRYRPHILRRLVYHVRRNST